MVTGVSGYLDFVASYGMTLRVYYSETYDVSTNTSDLVITKIQVLSTDYWGIAYYLNGTIKIDNATVVSMSSHAGDHSVYVAEPNTFFDVNGSLGSASGITHNNDGTKSVSITVSVVGETIDGKYNSGWAVSTSQSVALTTIPRASEITSVADVTLGDACNVKWTPKSASFRYKLHFRLGNWSHTTDPIHPNNTTEYTYRSHPISMDAAEEIPNAKTGTMTVELRTYSDSGATEQIGDADSATFTVTVPDNDSTRPEVSMILTPVSSLPDAFDGLYIQGKTKIRAELSAIGKYDATISSHSMKVENSAYDSEDDYTSDYLAQYGRIPVYGYATDSRGFTGSISDEITVLPYTKPKILTVDGAVIANRCDAEGNPIDSGTYLKIKAKRSYSLLNSEGAQHNYCKIQYRYKLESAESYSDWVTILDGNSLTSDEVETEPLLGGVLSAKSTYVVEVRAIDDIGEAGPTTIVIPTDTVYMHRTKNGMSLGKYAERENLLDVAWDTHLRGEVKIGAEGMTLREYILAVISEGG